VGWEFKLRAGAPEPGEDAGNSNLVVLTGGMKLAEGSLPACAAKETFANARFPCLSPAMESVSETGPFRRNRVVYLLSSLSVMAAGLLWRSRFVTLPPFLTKYGGDALWALLVFFAFGVLFPRITTLRLAAISLGFAWLVEFSQLYQAPWIDAIRSLRIGRLILGSTFNWPDLPAYAVGVAIGAVVERAGAKKRGRCPDRGRN
jgi:Protein of unknown function (DUF2809)